MMNTAPSTSSAASASLAAGSSGFANQSVAPAEKDKDSQWYFTADELANSPSRRHGIDGDTELSYRQMTAYLIQEMGQRLKVSQLCINTAIVYMHRFYAFHSFTHFHRNGIASASLFLAAKVEEQPRKLEHVIKAANKCLNQQTPASTEAYFLEQAQDLVFNENVLLQTLGFDVAIDHPHTHVVKTCHLVKACKDLTKTSYFLASNSLHLTSMCLQYRPTVVACFCIYLACKWSRWEIPQSTEGKHWFHYVDKSVTMELLKQLTDEFIAIYEKSPARLKSKLNSIKALAQGAGNNRPVGKDKKVPTDDWKVSDMLKMYHSSENSNHSGGGSEHQQQQQSPHMSMSSMLPPPQQSQMQSQQQQQHQQLPPPQQQQLQQQQQQQPQQMQKSSQSSMQQQQQQSQQQIRKSDMHSNQHRSQSFHSKHGFAQIGDMTDHKSSYKNPQSQQSQPGYNNGNQNPAAFGNSGRIRDHSQSSQSQISALPPPSAPSNQGSRSNMQMPSSGRVAQRNTGHQVPPSNVRQTVPGSAQFDRRETGRDFNEHMHPMLNQTHSVASHKSSLKGENTGRMQAPKESKHKIFGTSINPPMGMRDYPNPNTNSNPNQLQPQNNSMTVQPGNSGHKGDATHDLSRGVRYRSSEPSPNIDYLGSEISQTGQHRQPNTNTSIANNISTSTTISGKMDHNKGISTQAPAVHMQSQMHMPNMQTETSYPNAAASGHEMQQQTYSNQQQNQNKSYQVSLMMRNVGFEDLLGEDPMNPLYSSNVPSVGHQPAQSTMKSSTSSGLFAKSDMTDSKMQHNMNVPADNFGGSSAVSDTNGSQRGLTTVKGELSPRGTQMNREKDRERFKTSPSSKKEKHRHSMQPSSSYGTGVEGNSSNQLSQQQRSTQQYMYKKSDGNEQTANANATGLGAGIRHLASIMSVEDVFGDPKGIKLETMGSSGLLQQHSDPMASEMGKLSHVVNGIETNPDMVRNLLKESLCTSSALIKHEPDTKPPAELFATACIEKDLSNLYKSSCESASIVKGDDITEGKDREKQKKNKKEKHKHKEKDKSKDRDREERKKHKKDKDRHKDKDRDQDNVREQRIESDRPAESVEPFKIKIRKDILESTSLNPPPFKIKIAKDRIIGDLNLGLGGTGNNTGTSHNRGAVTSTGQNASLQVNLPSTLITTSEQKPNNPTLKIKISKEKIHQHSLSTNVVAPPPPGGTSFSASLEQPNVSNTGLCASYFNPHNQSGSNVSMSSTGSHSHSHHSSGGSGSGSSKKKDRDRDRSRDRERDKKRHCSENSRTAVASLSSNTGIGITASGNSTHSSSSSNNSHSRAHNSNKH